MNKDEQQYIELSKKIASRIESAAYAAVGYGNDVTTCDLKSLDKAIDGEIEKCKPIIREFFVVNGYDLERIDEFISEAVQNGISDLVPK